MTDETILFDIDGTLLTADIFVNKLSHPKDHLTQVSVPGIKHQLYAIHLEITGSLFRELQKKSINIGFITAAGYNEQTIKKFFFSIYRLENTLDDCIFIGRDSFGDMNTNKGQKISAAQEAGILTKDANKIRLVDDDHVHILSARDLGYKVTVAGGFPSSNRLTVNHSYLQEIISAYELDIALPTHLTLHAPVDIHTPQLRLHANLFAQYKMLSDKASKITDEECCCWLPALLRKRP